MWSPRSKATTRVYFDESTKCHTFYSCLHIYWWIFKCDRWISTSFLWGVIFENWFVKVHPSGYFCSVAPHMSISIMFLFEHFKIGSIIIKHKEIKWVTMKPQAGKIYQLKLNTGTYHLWFIATLKVSFSLSK